jgi:hypothetical protein
MDAGTPRIGGRFTLRADRPRPVVGWALGPVLGCAALSCVVLMLAPAHAAATLGPVLKPNVTAVPPWYAKSQELSLEGQERYVMRFNGWIGNEGPGRLEIRGRRSSPSEPMKVYQRLYREGAKETYAGNEPDEYEEVLDEHAELHYDSSEGFALFHLMDIAHYSLWNYAKTKEVVPSEKVGFCLGDDEHLESGKGPSTAFYVDSATGHCAEGKPEALSLWEGISIGWLDWYEYELPLQWVDVSKVPPGRYWLRDDSDPDGFLVENGPPSEAVKHAYSKWPVTVRGYDALGQSDKIENDEAKTLTLASEAFPGEKEPLGNAEMCRVANNPKYEIRESPEHGTLTVVSGNHVTYTPQAEYEGADSFTFVARNPNCRFPLEPVEATVSLAVTAPVITTTTTTTTLTSASSTATTTAPTTSTSASPMPNTTTTTSTTVARTLAATGTTHKGTDAKPPLGVTRLQAAIHGHSLLVSALAGNSGLLRLSAWLHGHRLGRCSFRVHSGETMKCRIALSGHTSANGEIVVWGTLTSGKHTFQKHRRLAQGTQRGYGAASKARVALSLRSAFADPALAALSEARPAVS